MPSEPANFRAAARYPILAIAVSMVAFISIKTGRDAVFFAQGGLRQLPLAYILIAAVAIPGGMLHLAAIECFGARRVRTGSFLVVALLFALFVPFVDREHPGAMLALFSLVPAAFAAVLSGGWLLAGDLLEGAEQETQRSTYSRIGVASMLGGLAGGLVSTALAPFLEPRLLVAFGALMLVLAGAIVSRAHRDHPAVVMPGASDVAQPRGSPGAALRSSAFVGLVKDPYVRGLAAISALAAAAALYIDFQFYATATLNGHVDAGFFGGFYTVVNAAALALQCLAAPWIQHRYGVRGALMVLPLALLGVVTGTVLISATVLAGSVLRVAEAGLKSSIHRSSWEQVFLPIGGIGRDMAKVLVDGLFGRIAEGVTALALLVWLRNVPELHADLSLSWVSWAIIAVVLLWIVTTRSLTKREGPRPIGEGPVPLRLPDS